MPIYEYRCNRCNRKSSLLVRSSSSPSSLNCEYCGSEDLVRVMSRFAYHRSEGDRMADLDTGKPTSDDYYRDSRNIGLWAKKRARELGVGDVLEPHFEGIVESAQAKVKDMLAD